MYRRHDSGTNRGSAPMARTTYVQHAKARDGVAPVIDPTLGLQRVIPVLGTSAQGRRRW